MRTSHSYTQSISMSGTRREATAAMVHSTLRSSWGSAMDHAMPRAGELSILWA